MKFKIEKELDIGVKSQTNIYLDSNLKQFAVIQPLTPNKETKNILQEIRRGENLDEITFEQLKDEAKCIK